MNEGTWNSLSIHINKQSILWLLPVITVLSRRIQGKGATAALKIIIKFSAILLRTKFTRDQPVFNSIIEFTCLLIKGGRNSNKADAHGVSWEDILSTSTPCLSKPWISWGTKRYWKELSKEREIVMLICNGNDNNCYFLMVQQCKLDWQISWCFVLRWGLTTEKGGRGTFKSAYTSGILSISPSGRRITPWYLSEQNRGIWYLDLNTHTHIQ